MSLISREGTINLSNMPAISEEPYTDCRFHSDKYSKYVMEELIVSPASVPAGEKWKITKFDRTPPVRMMRLEIL